ncbi:MAG: cobalamin B12-binding domain-containing protein [Gemmatimonadaceae bacterium]|nr:cobalamin B12-binding domain-containing protein [Gemmatimonadaceae bacterium]
MPHPGAGQAAGAGRALVQTVESELLPRLGLAHRGSGDAAHGQTQTHAHGQAGGQPQGRRPVIGPGEVEAFLARVLDEREPLPGAQVLDLLDRGATVESIYCDLLGPAARELGDRWNDDTCDFLQVTVGLGRLQETLRELSATVGPATARTDQPGSALITGLPDEQHTLGLLIVAECFVRDGWSVNVGHPLMDQGLVDAVRNDWYDVVGISMALPERAAELRGTITRVRRASRNPAIVVLLGGHAFLEDASLVQVVGADDGIGDARDAARVARVALAARGPQDAGRRDEAMA